MGLFFFFNSPGQALTMGSRAGNGRVWVLENSPVTTEESGFQGKKARSKEASRGEVSALGEKEEFHHERDSGPYSHF